MDEWMGLAREGGGEGEGEKGRKGGMEGVVV